MIEGMHGFEHKVDQIPMGGKHITYTGILNHRWGIYLDPQMENNRMLIGIEGTEEYGHLSIDNFII